jgi:hypothetical protein
MQLVNKKIKINLRLQTLWKKPVKVDVRLGSLALMLSGIVKYLWNSYLMKVDKSQKRKDFVLWFVVE